MSAFPDKPNHFIEWLISKKELFLRVDTLLLLTRQHLLTRIYNEIEDLSAASKLEIIGGRIKNIEETDNALVASVQLRKTW